MKVINNKKLFESIDNVGKFEPRIHPEVPASFAAAVEDARKQEEHAEEVFKEKEKESKDSGLGNTEKDREGYKIKYNPGAKKMHLEESLFEEDEVKEEDIYLVKKKRDPLADIIQERLTTGEWGYVKHPDGTVNPTQLGGANYTSAQIGMEYDKEDNSYIKVTASTEEELDKAKNIADKFEREYEVVDMSKKAGVKPGYEFKLLIKLKDEDWDKPYYNPNDAIYESMIVKESKAEDSKFAKKYPDRFEKIKKLYSEKGWDIIPGEALDEVAKLLGVDLDETLTEASDIKVKVYNFRPSTEEGRETYKKISEAGKLGNLQDMLEEMYPDEEEINADEMNKLLSEKADWVLDMLDIHEEEAE